MRQVTEIELKKRLAFDNPWWETGGVDLDLDQTEPRDYFDSFFRLVHGSDVRRAVILMGPRRVGKTVMIHHAIRGLIETATPVTSILYLSLDTPIYNGASLERLLGLFTELHGHARDSELYVFFDEIQYLKNWEVHLKSLVDSYRRIRFVGSGSAAAALKLKSEESGAGRFTDFLLPPLTFAEYLRFARLEERLIRPDEIHRYEAEDYEQLNNAFVDYVNFGGYPEAVFSEAIRRDPARYIRSDIIDKVLLRDLPSLYGIGDIQELNSLFTTLAYNTASEVSYEGLSQSSGVAKNTLRRYLTYLEAAFLIRRVHRVDQNARRFKRATTFKVYLTNPSMRAALFGTATIQDDAMASLAETAVLSRWLDHAGFSVSYARWKHGEVDMVATNKSTLKPFHAIEVKWSDRLFDRPQELTGLLSFARRNGLRSVLVTTLTRAGARTVEGINVAYRPCSLHCYAGATSLAAALQEPQPQRV